MTCLRQLARALDSVRTSFWPRRARPFPSSCPQRRPRRPQGSRAAPAQGLRHLAGYTWEDVVSTACATIAMGLAALGVERGETVAIVGENEPELFWCEVRRALRRRQGRVRSTRTSPLTQMEYVLQHSEAVVVIVRGPGAGRQGAGAGGASCRGCTCIIYWDARGMWKYAHPQAARPWKGRRKGPRLPRAAPRRPSTAPSPPARASDIAVLSYTSGTTGNPKACILTHHYLLAATCTHHRRLDFKPDTQYLSYISARLGRPSSSSASPSRSSPPFIVNFPEEPETVQENIREIGAEALMLSPPRIWESLTLHVEAKMMDAGFIRRGVFRAGMAIGKRVNLARSRRQGPRPGRSRLAGRARRSRRAPAAARQPRPAVGPRRRVRRLGDGARRVPLLPRHGRAAAQHLRLDRDRPAHAASGHRLRPETVAAGCRSTASSVPRSRPRSPTTARSLVRGGVGLRRLLQQPRGRRRRS